MRLVHYFGLNDPVSSLTHITAAVGALGGTFFLYKKGRGNVLHTSSLMIFSASLLFLFSMSGVYHGLPPGPWRTLFRRLDYAGIWIVIAGSATPVQILLLKGHWRWGMTALFWGAALTSLILIDVYFTTLPYWAIVGAYIGVSSLGGITYARITARYGWKESSLLFLGGIAYIAGALIDFVERPVIIAGVFGPHEFFHVLVIVGAALHWSFVYNWAGRQDIIKGHKPG